MECIGFQTDGGELFVADLDLLGIARVSRMHRTLRPVGVRVLPISFTIIAWVSSGCPRQFRLMKENSRCSILFHLLVPGGK